MDYCEVKKGTTYESVRKKKVDESSVYDEEVQFEIYLMDEGELELCYKPNLKNEPLNSFLRAQNRKMIKNPDFERLFSINMIEDGDFFGDIDFILQNRKSDFKGVFVEDSKFWAIRGEMAQIVIFFFIFS